MQNREEGQHKQEEACAQTFLDWLGSQCGISYELQRAEEVRGLRGRWDFVAQVKGHTDWLAVEVKALVVSEERKKLGNWSRFCRWVTKELQLRGTIQGTFAVFTSPSWAFNPAQAKTLVTAFVEALVEVAPNLGTGAAANLGPGIAKRFSGWPQKRSASSPRFDKTQGRVVHDLEDLGICKIADTGCAVEIGAIVYGVFEIDSALNEAISGIFAPRGGKGTKPNEQLREARQKGASETVLLLDSHIRWKPNVIVQVLKSIDQTLLSDIDGVYMVSVANSRVKRVWPERQL